MDTVTVKDCFTLARAFEDLRIAFGTVGLQPPVALVLASAEQMSAFERMMSGKPLGLARDALRGLTVADPSPDLGAGPLMLVDIEIRCEG